jgi:hypothetical protein
MNVEQLNMELLYFAGCPSYQRAQELLVEALAAEGIEAPIHLVAVETEAEAHRVSFYGSPTIRINGRDIAPVPEGGAPSLACRLYYLPDGRLTPVPTYETLVAALRQQKGAKRNATTEAIPARRATGDRR